MEAPPPSPRNFQEPNINHQLSGSTSATDKPLLLLSPREDGAVSVHSDGYESCTSEDNKASKPVLLSLGRCESSFLENLLRAEEEKVRIYVYYRYICYTRVL